MERYCFENMFLRTEKIVTVSACDSDGIVVIYRHYPYRIPSLSQKTVSSELPRTRIYCYKSF